MDRQDLLRLEGKVDKISDQVGAINVTLAEQHVTLKEHIRRTEALEKIVAPVTPVVTIVKFVAEVVGVLAASGFLYEIVKRLL